MLWFSVWTVLVVGTLVGAFWLGRDLWRKARALLDELNRATTTLERLEERQAELAALAPAHPVEPVDLVDPTRAHERLATARLATQERRAARAARHEAVYARWRSFSR